MATTIQTDVPLVNAPLVDPETGRVTETWFLFLIQLWRRTGGGGGTPPETLTVADVLALEQVISPLTAVGEGTLENEMTATLPCASVPSALSEMVFPPIVPDIVNQTFSSGPGFTPGTSTTLTLDSSFANAARLWVFFDAAFQGDDQYSLNGSTLTFTGPIPVGVNKVYIKGLG